MGTNKACCTKSNGRDKKKMLRSFIISLSFGTFSDSYVYLHPPTRTQRARKVHLICISTLAPQSRNASRVFLRLSYNFDSYEIQILFKFFFESLPTSVHKTTNNFFFDSNVPKFGCVIYFTFFFFKVAMAMTNTHHWFYCGYCGFFLSTTAGCVCVVGGYLFSKVFFISLNPCHCFQLIFFVCVCALVSQKTWKSDRIRCCDYIYADSVAKMACIWTFFGDIPS